MADDTECTAKLFTNGGSQAVRLPKAFRLPGTAVRVRRMGNGVLLEPIEAPGWPPGFWERLDALGPVGDEFDVGERDAPPEPRRDAAIDELTEWLDAPHRKTR